MITKLQIKKKKNLQNLEIFTSYYFNCMYNDSLLMRLNSINIFIFDSSNEFDEMYFIVSLIPNAYIKTNTSNVDIIKSFFV